MDTRFKEKVFISFFTPVYSPLLSEENREYYCTDCLLRFVRIECAKDIFIHQHKGLMMRIFQE